MYSPSGQSGAYIFIIIAVVVALRIFRSSGVRPVNLTSLVITSVLVLFSAYEILAVSGTTAAGGFSGAPSPTSARPAAPQGAMLFYAIGLCLGLVLGVVRGHATSMFRDAATGKVMQKASMYTYLVWVGLLAIRYGVRYLASAALVGAWAGPLSDALLMVGTGSVLGRNAYVFWRYWQLSRLAGVSVQSGGSPTGSA